MKEYIAKKRRKTGLKGPPSKPETRVSFFFVKVKGRRKRELCQLGKKCTHTALMKKHYKREDEL